MAPVKSVCVDDEKLFEGEIYTSFLFFAIWPSHGIVQAPLLNYTGRLSQQAEDSSVNMLPAACFKGVVLLLGGVCHFHVSVICDTF